MRRSGGTDAGSLLTRRTRASPASCSAVPARYIHSHNAIIDIEDYLAMLKLTIALAEALDQDTVDSLTRFI